MKTELGAMPSKHIMRDAIVGFVVATGLIAAPTAAGSTPGITSHTVVGSAAKAERIKDFWTAKRMRHAEPLPLVEAPVKSSARSNSSPTSATGKPRKIPPSLPHGGTGDLTRRATQIINPSVYPYSTQGKLFFRRPSHPGYLYFCSATVVNTPSKRVIFSAGHCAIEGGPWSTNVAFVPGYKNGNKPYGTFAVSKLYALNAWIYHENFSYDMSAMVLYKQVANVVGARGILWNRPAYQHYVSYGYPVSYPFNGQLFWSCPSWLGGRDPYTSSPQTMWITCNMTGGSSGGGWIIQNQYLNSVNSYGYDRYPNRMYGPYFGNAARDLYNGVKYVAP